jgi:hypothetical protein
VAIRQDSGGKHYQYKTEFFGLPVPGNEKMTVEAEHHRWEIVENVLLAATKGVFCAVFEDGHYQLVDNIDGTYTVLLTGTGHEWALVGVLNGGLVKSSKPIIWENLRKGQTYWLYIQYQEGQFKDPSLFTTVVRFNNIGDDVRRLLLLCKVNADGTIDEMPPGKTYSSDIAQHSNDSVNPHGEVLRQDDVVARRLFTVKDVAHGRTEDVLLYDGQTGILDAIINRRIVHVDALTAGKNGEAVVVPKAKRILMAQVHERFVPGVEPLFGLGEVVLDYDSERVAPGSVVIYNSGKPSVPVRLNVVAEF